MASKPGDKHQPAFNPTPEQRKQAETLSGFGIPQDDIARLIGVSKPTLHKYFRDELDNGIAKANASVGQSLFKMATSGNNTAAAIFWMKARAGWREKQEIDINVRRDPATLSDADLAAEIRAGGLGTDATPEGAEESGDVVH